MPIKSIDIIKKGTDEIIGEDLLIKKLNSMQLEKILMTEEIDALKTNPAFIELVARKQLGLVRSGELIFYLPESTKNHP